MYWHPRTQFENAEWPVVKGDQISHLHFEDLRKYIWMLRNRVTGYVLPTTTEDWVVSYSEPLSTVLHKKYTYHFGYFDNFWYNTADITKGDYTSLSGAPPQDINPDTTVNYDGDTYNCIYDHKSGDTFDASKWSITTYTANPNCGNWTARTHYTHRIWVLSNSKWALAPDYVHYHQFDINGNRTLCYTNDGKTAGSPTYDRQELTCSAYQSLPQQTDPKELLPPVKYIDTSLIDWQIKSKVPFEQTVITNPGTQGAVYPVDVIKYELSTGYWFYRRMCPFSGVDAQGDQYTNGEGNYPCSISASGSGTTGTFTDFYGNEYSGGMHQCIKVGSSYQATIEQVVNSGSALPVDDTYHTNWLAWRVAYDASYVETEEDKCPEFAPVNDIYWGCNASGFELYLKMNADYDWYYDIDTPYVLVNHMAARDIQTDNSNDPDDYPLPAGSWRISWKNSLGKIRPLTRPFEMGEPTFTSYTGDIVSPYQSDGYMNGTYPVWYPSNTWINTHPALSEFFETTVSPISITQSHSTGLYSIIKLSGDYSYTARDGETPPEGIKKGNTILMADDVTSYLECYVLSVNYTGGYTYIEVDKDVSDYSTFCHDSRTSERHDPVDVDYKLVEGVWIAKPIYKLTTDLVNEMSKMLHGVTYEEISPTLEAGVVSVSTNQVSIGDYSMNYLPLGRTNSLIPDDVDDWFISDTGSIYFVLTAYTFSQGVWSYGSGSAAVYSRVSNGWINDGGYITGNGYARKDCVAYRATIDIAMLSLVKYAYIRFKNYKWISSNDLSFSDLDFNQMQACSVGGMSTTPYLYEDPPANPDYYVYKYVQLAVNGSAFILLPSFPSAIAKIYDPPSTTEGSNSGGARLLFDLDLGGLPQYVMFDFTKAPDFVWKRDLISLIEPEVTPIQDVKPPKPLKPEQYKNPEAYWVYIPEVLSPATDEYFELWCRVYSCIEQDLEGNAVEYQFASVDEITIEPTSEGSERIMERKLADYTYDECIDATTGTNVIDIDAVPSGSTSNPSGTITRITCSNTTKFRVDDIVLFTNVSALGSEDGYVLTNVTSTYIEIDRGTYSAITFGGTALVALLSVIILGVEYTEEESYDITNWRNTDYSGIKIKVRAKDSIPNYTEWGKMELELLPPTQTPKTVKDYYEE